MSPTPPANDVSALNAARRTAARLRAECLLLVNDGTVAPADVLREAAEPDSRALLKVSVRQLLLAQKGWGRARTESVISRILAVTDARIERRQVTIGWLLDPRAGGRRYAAWLDAFEPRSAIAAEGFPYARRSSDV